MSSTLTEPALRTLVSEIAQRDVSTADVDADLMEALDVDSLTALRVLAAVEKRFGVRIPDEQLSKTRTIRQLLALSQDQPRESQP